MNRLERTTPVPDEVLDYWVSVLTLAELRVLLFLIRRTYGWRKEEDQTSIEQICKGIVRRSDGLRVSSGTGLERRSVQRALRSLESKGLISKRTEFAADGRQLACTYSTNLRDEGGASDALRAAGEPPLGATSAPPPGAASAPPTTNKQTTNNFSADNSSTPAEGVNGSAGDSRELKEDSREDASLEDFLLVQARVWKCELDLARVIRVLGNLPCSPGLRRAIQHALIAHACKDATDAVIRTGKTWQKHGVGSAWDPDSFRASGDIVNWKDKEQVAARDDASDTDRLMWSSARAQPRPVWQRQAIADFIESLEEFGCDEQEFIESILTLLDCCRWNGPPAREALAPKLRSLWETIGRFPACVTAWAIVEHLGLVNEDGRLDGDLVDLVTLPLQYTSETDELPPFPSVPQFVRLAKLHRDWDQQEQERSEADTPNETIGDKQPVPERLVDALEAAAPQLMQQTPVGQHSAGEPPSVSEIFDKHDARLLAKYGGIP